MSKEYIYNFLWSVKSFVGLGNCQFIIYYLKHSFKNSQNMVKFKRSWHHASHSKRSGGNDPPKI